MPARRHVLVCLDAFGTIFSPKAPIATQYRQVAERHNVYVPDANEAKLHESFKAAFKYMSSNHPNYGKHHMSEVKWWHDLVERTFNRDILRNEEARSRLDSVAKALFTRFSSGEGYAAHTDARSLIERLHRIRRGTQLNVSSGSKMFLGIITNSDSRVASVLENLGYNVGCLRANSPASSDLAGLDVANLQFVVTSYDVGSAKPSKKIFQQAENMVRQRLLSDEEAGDPISKLYIGDDLKKDGQGANDAGWHSVVVCRGEDCAQFGPLGDPLQKLREVLEEDTVTRQRVTSLAE